ncbi:hypothetical protein [Kribbella sp. NBC_00889]|uniref:hypothetical protein n=1 Tax=Kribbella sp. NBC_00889 TaxID=2975974 RepID=UPI00386660D6|nr:hypothetical protein OG817_16435 [Kribbella sp. NBC_00889]
MTTNEQTAQPSPTKCWCCDKEYDERELVRLGAHPEVGICLACALDVKQRAGEREDELRPTATTGLRTGVRRSREWVIARDWHNRPVLGPLLRRINRHLP